MNYGKTVLTEALKNPDAVLAYGELDFDALISEAREQKLLAQLGGSWSQDSINCLPDRVRQHFESEQCVADYVKQSVQWEIERIYEALKKFDIKFVLLKGSAYSLANLDAGFGRIYQDIDILVRRDQIHQVESVLLRNGWVDDCKDEYDQKYYRRWMHELPPRRHIRTGTVLDVHHNIIPLTGRYCPSAESIFESAIPIVGTPYWRLCNEDMVLHSASHLFLNGEFDHGLRDLYDLYALLRQFERKDENFWSALLERSTQLGFDEVLFYALFYVKSVFQTPLSGLVKAKNNVLDLESRNPMFDWAFKCAFESNFMRPNNIKVLLAKWILFVRSHWLKMPWYLLFPHLSRKAWMRLTGREAH